MTGAVRIACAPVLANASLGPLRTHMFNYLLGETLRKSGGKIFIRCDDTDPNKGNREQFKWFLNFSQNVLGMKFDGLPGKEDAPVYQSERADLYDAKIEQLCDSGLAFRDPGTKAIHFDLEKYTEKYGDKATVSDMVLGTLNVKYRNIIENGRRTFPLRRSDGHYLYHFTAPVDDGEMGVTHVSRGRDKMDSLGYHEAVKKALGYPPSVYFHLPLLLNEEGHLLKGETYFTPNLIKEGHPPAAIAAYLFSSCHPHQGPPNFTFQDMLEVFDPKKISRSNGKFDAKKLASMTRAYVNNCPPEDFTNFLEAYVAENDPQLAQKIDQHREIFPFLSQHRRDFQQTASLAKAMLIPDFSQSELTEDFKAEARAAIQKVKSGGLSAKFAEAVDAKAMRWVLTGKQHGMPVEPLIQFLDRNHLLEERLTAASLKLSKS